MQEARAIAPRIDEVQRQLQGRDWRSKGKMRLTTAFATVQYLLADALADFARVHPGISVEVLESGALLDLARREADAALRFSRQPSEHWVGRQLGVVQYRVYAKGGAPGLPRSPIALNALLSMAPWIEFGGTDNRCSRWMQAYLSRDQVRFVSTPSRAWWRCCAADAAWACFLPKWPRRSATWWPCPKTSRSWRIRGAADLPDIRRTVRIQASCGTSAMPPARG